MSYRPRDRVEVWIDERWNPGAITHVGPTPTIGLGPMTLPALGPRVVRVLIDRTHGGGTIQVPVDDPEVLRPVEGAPS